MIPKVIHYCWFGGKPLTPLAKKCIKSWRKFCPDYKIIRWDESNFDMNNKSPYFQEAYKAKKWGFTADYPRFWIIYNYGGIYLDTDVELLKSLDPLLKYNSFFGFESEDMDGTNRIATGLGFGAVKGNSIVYNLLNTYYTRHFIKKDGSVDLSPSPHINKQVFDEIGVNSRGSNQIIANNIFLSSEYFCPKKWYNDDLNITENTFSIHHFAKSWVPKDKIIIRLKKTVKNVIYKPSKSRFKNSEVHSVCDSNERIISELASEKPCFIARCGGTELECCEEDYYVRRKIIKSFSPQIREKISLWSGVFPNDDYSLKRFATFYSKSIKKVTTFAVWGNRNFESFFIKRNSKCRVFIPWHSLFPCINDWTKILVGRKVLVVSSFASTIKKQYKKRELLFEDHNILPKFQLITYKSIVSYGWANIENTNGQKYPSWEHVLYKMFDDIKAMDFDVCLISCGAYGLPLGSLIYNNMHKDVVHVGGSLQLLFGIKGAVYEKDERIKPFINEHWVYPSEEETPEVASKIENYCYWKPKENN